MPKRSNTFQKLIHLIHLQLTKSKVIESAMFVDKRTGEEREVDIAVISDIANHLVVVSIECRDHKRPQSTGWVEEMWGKHQALPTNTLVLVSSSGFYKPALKAAKQLGIEALSLDEATETNWSGVNSIIRKFILKEIWTTPVRCTVIPNEAWIPQGIDALTLSKFMVFSENKKSIGSLNEVFAKAVNSIDFKPSKDAPLNEPVSMYVDSQYRFNKGTFLIDDKNNEVLLRELAFRVRFDSVITTQKPKNYIFNEQLIQVAESANMISNVIYSTVTDENNKVSCGASLINVHKAPDACKWDIAIPIELAENIDSSIVKDTLNYKDPSQFETSGKPSPEPPKLSIDFKRRIVTDKDEI